MIPTLNHYSDIVSDIPSGSIYGIFILTFFLAYTLLYFDILSGIYSDTLSGMYSHILSGVLSGFYFDILSGIFSGILSGICSDIFSVIFSGKCIWHIFWHSFWHSIWYIFGDSLWLRSGGEHCDLALAVEVRRGSLWSWACRSGPAGNS